MLKADSTNGQTGAVEWTFSLNDNTPAFQALGVNDTLTQTYRVTISDGDVTNGAVSQDVTVTIHGTNDAPVLTYNSGTSTVTEDDDAQSGYLFLQANYDPTDVDGDLNFSGSGVFVNATTTGGAVVSAALLQALQSGFQAYAGYQANYGAYAETYLVLDNSIVQYLGTGQSVTANYRFTVTDDHGGSTDQIVTYTVLGKDEAGNAVPTITSPSWVVSINEDESIGAQSPELIRNGGFEADLSNGWTVSIPAGGDAGRAGVPHSGGANAVFENYYANLPTTLSQNISTVAGEHYTLSFWLFQPYGRNNSFTVAWNGNVVGSLVNTQEFGNDSPSHYVHYTYDVVGDADGTSALLFTFVNKLSYWYLDDVSLKAAFTSGTEIRSGLIAFSDANIADTHTVGFAPVGSGYVGTFNASVTNPSTGDGAGIVTWNFTASDADLQYLAAGQTVKQFYDVTISDNFSPTHGTVTQRVEVDLVGVNDAPTDIVFRDVANAVVDPASGTTTLTILKTAATGAAVGNAHGIDLDTSDVLTYAFWNGTTASQTSADGIFPINSATGAITVASATLLAAQSGSHSYTIQVTDQGGAGVSYNEGLTIAVGTPVNHDPIAVNDDLNFATGPQANPPANLTGWVFNTANGHYYKIVTTALPFAQAEAAAEAAGGHLATITSAAENTFIRGIMSSGQTLLIGASDAETEGVWKWVYGPEAGTVFWNGGPSGSVVAGGYAPWNAGEPNNSGNEDVATIQFSTSSWNDIPATLASGYVMEWSPPTAEQKGILENASKTFSAAVLLANDSDPDGDPVSLFSVQATSTKGATVTYDAGTGQVTYNAATSSQLAALTYGQSTTDTFTYTVTDTHGATSTATATITVAGKNDAPAVGAPGVGQVTEDLDLTAVQGERVTNGNFSNGTNGFTIANVNTTYSGLVFAGGSTAYSIYTMGTTVPTTLTQTLATTAGVTYDVSLSIANNNSSNNGITVYWNGVAYLALANIPTTGSYDIFTQYTFQAVAASSSTTFQIAAFSPSASVTFDNISVHAATSETASGVITFTDSELADSHTVAASAHATGYVGNFTANITDLATGDGSGKVTWLFNVENSQIQNLGQGQSVQQVYTIAISDSHGNTTNQDVTVTINGTNDAPVLGNDTVKLGGYTIDAFPATVGSTPILAEVENNSSSSPQDISRSLFKVATNANLGDSTLPSITITGSIGSNSDKDFFKIFLKQGETIVLDVDNTTGGLDTYLLLRPSPTGSSLIFNDDWTNGGSGSGSSGHPTDSYLSYTATSSATYYIDLESFNSSSKGNYQLQVSIGNFTPDASGTNRIAVSDLLANDSDKDSNDHLTITGVTGTGVALVDNNTSIEVQAGVTSFTYTATDGHVSQTATVAVQELNTGTTIAGTAADEVLVGSASADTINGGAGKDILYGGGGNDILNGGSENDILVGGLGNDTLTGGTGADTFRFAETGPANRDIITDYHFNEGDKIDLSALLDANFGSGSAVSDFVRLTPSGGDVVVQVDVDGAGTANTWADVATLQGYNTVGNQVLLQFEQQAHQLAVA